jgi:proteasome assembly chaperone (PAC2) family protein
MIEKPRVYCAASDEETLREALNLGAETMVGQIFGVAGLLIGIGKFQGFRGFSLLVETPGFYPDAAAARIAISTVSKYLNLKIDLSRLDLAVEMTKTVLESFGLLESPKTKKEEKETPQFRWFI